GIDAAELADPAFVGRRHLGAAHRQRPANGLYGAEPVARALGETEKPDVDLDLVHLLHAADVSVTELLERIYKGTGPLETGGGVDDLVAVGLAAAALGSVLRVQRKALDRGRRLLHRRIVGIGVGSPQDLTRPPCKRYAT